MYMSPTRLRLIIANGIRRASSFPVGLALVLLLRDLGSRRTHLDIICYSAFCYLIIMTC
jgi:hypothetical protein